MKDTLHKTKTRYGVIVAALALLFLLLLSGVQVWQFYQNTLMDNQTEQLLLISQTLGRNLQVTLRDYEDNLAFLSQIEERKLGIPDFYETYLRENEMFADLQWSNSEGECVKSLCGLELREFILLAQPSQQVSYWQCRDEDRIYLAMRRQLSEGRYLSLIVNEELYYEKLISDIHVGTNGYIVAKNATGRIVLHPSKEQWGIDVIQGRQELYPGLSDSDMESLSQMIQKQIKNEMGTYQYTSYWWTDPEMPRVRKVSAHTHVHLGQDFFIVSAVVDYSDFYSPIQDSARNILLVFLGVLLVFLGLAFFVGRLLLDREKASSEIRYLKELNETLEELHRREKSLSHQQRLQMMGTMTGGIAHEFNNFLTPIMGHADLLMTQVPEDSVIYDSAKEIYEASEKAREIVRQLSAMSRKNVETVYKSVNAKAMLLRNLKMLDAITPERIGLKQEIKLQNEHFLGNATQIHQVLMNLYTNALNAIGAQEGVITFRGKSVSRAEVVRQFSLETVARDWQHYIQIDVQDTGCGMDNATLRRIFQPFYTTRKTGEGTGLGLSLAEQIIRTHRGYICAESEKGKGATFHIFLPVLEPGEETEQHRWGQSQQLKIMVADDNVKILEMLERQFAKLDTQIITCTRKNQLAGLLKQQYVDVLAIDESMEDEDGIAFCMSIQGKFPDMIKIVMTNMVTRELIDAKHRHIIDGYVVKPVSDTTLLAEIRSCWDHSSPE